MPRPRLFRRVRFQPSVTYFKPAGVRMIELGETILAVDEFEAVRLKDLLGLDQDTCAKKMKISQPTFHRLVLSARKKIADALVNGKAIRIQGGSFKMVQPRGFGRGQGAGRGRGMGAGRGRGMGFQGPAMTCVCPSCGYREPKKAGVPCLTLKCPECGGTMARGE